MRTPRSPRRRSRTALALALWTAAVIWLIVEPITGTHMMHLFGSHGIDSGDLVAVGIAAIGIAVWCI